jgi:ABC-type multidrug transport system permease subunit
MTHGVVALFRGDVLGSLAENAFAWVVVLGLLVSLIVVFAGLQRKIPSFVSGSRVTLLVGIPFAAYSVGRNLV